MTFQEAEANILNLGMFGIKLGLEQSRALFEECGADFRAIRFAHIAGTNGKGSCGAMLQQMLRGAGFTVGFYSSPHLISVRERFRVNGRAISEEEFAECAATVLAAAKRLEARGLKATYFEVTTAIALVWFARRKVDFAVWETGMGGRLDATNVVTPEISIITNIAFDHQKYLGNTLAAIASEKAGIIKPGAPVVVGKLPPEAAAVVRARAAELNAPLHAAAEPESLAWENVGGFQCAAVHGVEMRLPLKGAMQRRNFMVALKAMELLSADEAELKRALQSLERVHWWGRMQEVQPKIWTDGGHNPDGAAALAEAIRETLAEKPVIVFGAFKDKDAATELALLEDVAKSFIFVPIHCEGEKSARGCHSSEELGAMVHIGWEAAPNVAAAVERVRAGGDTVLVGGSLYLAAELLENYADPRTILNI